MDSYQSGYRYSGVDRRPGIVSGKNFNNSQTYAPRNHSPDLQSVPPRAAGVSSSSAAKPWSFGDPDTKRRKRIAKYKVYTVEGKVKSSLRKGLRWFKNKCHAIIHGYQDLEVIRWLNHAPAVPEIRGKIKTAKDMSQHSKIHGKIIFLLFFLLDNLIAALIDSKLRKHPHGERLTIARRGHELGLLM